MAKQKTVSKADLVDLVSGETGMKKKDVKEIMDTMLDKISVHLDANRKVQLTGFGTFETRKRKARTGVKPGTTEKITIPSNYYPTFKPGRTLTKSVEKPYRSIKDPAVPSTLDPERLDEVLRTLRK